MSSMISSLKIYINTPMHIITGVSKNPMEATNTDLNKISFDTSRNKTKNWTIIAINISNPCVSNYVFYCKIYVSIITSQITYIPSPYQFG